MFLKTNSLLKELHKERLTKIIDSFFHATDKHTKANFCDYMKLYEINAVFREGQEGRVYGLTLVDNRKYTVVNGSDLGKGYSGQSLMKRFNAHPSLVMTGEKERHVVVILGAEAPQLDIRDLSLPNWIHDIAKEFFNVMKAEKIAMESPFQFQKKTRKKKKKGMRL